MIEYAGYYLLAILGLIIIVKLFSWPLKILFKLIINAVLGVITLVLVNIVGAGFGLTIGVNIFTALIVGFLGVPGVIFLVVLKYIL